MNRLRVLIILLILMATPALPQARQEAPAAPPTIATKTAGTEKLVGYFHLYWDAKGGKLWLEIDKWDAELLYVNSLTAGVGSNDIGLDRGQLGDSRIVRFERSGPRVLLVEPNYQYRALTDSADERRAVRDSFAESVLWGFDVAAEEDSRVLVDASSFFLRDAHDVIGAMRRAQQGTFRLEATRSGFFLPRTKNFPKNTEVEVTLTFTSDDPGGWVRQVTPTPQAVTVRQHHSFVELPAADYAPRAFDPRAGFFGIEYMDYSTPVSEPIRKRFIARHRLQKKDPRAAASEAVEPIVYYLDRGTPEPIRTALLDGAGWWAQAFEAAGFRNAFRVEMMPEGADAMDLRYNVIQWVHRSTRGWSYGSTVTDPRTGEILKGHVTLGSLRVRQDYLIAEGLLAPYEKGKALNPKMLEMALARLRQLSAHEVGHTLGLMHSYAASITNRASVMDYPHPLVKLDADGVPDVSDAYATGIGEWDKAAIAYGYSEFRSGANESAELNKIVAAAQARGLVFLTDQDARPPGSASPIAHLWDNGANAVAELGRVMQVRAAALRRFGENNIREGAPMATLEDVLVPIYLYHRYQVEAAAKLIGGVDYRFAVRGDGQITTRIVAAEEQRRALEAVLATLTPEVLALPEPLLAMMPPHPPGAPRSRETFRARTGIVFDALAPAEAAAHHVIGLLMNVERASRLVENHARNNAYPSLPDVLDRVLAATWKTPQERGMPAQVRRTVSFAVLYHLMALAANNSAPAQVRAVATWKLGQLGDWLKEAQTKAELEGERAHFFYAAQQIEQFLKDPKQPSLPRPLEPPDGPPIGADDCNWVW